MQPGVRVGTAPEPVATVRCNERFHLNSSSPKHSRYVAIHVAGSKECNCGERSSSTSDDEDRNYLHKLKTTACLTVDIKKNDFFTYSRVVS